MATYGGWELCTLWAICKGDPKLMKQATGDGFFNTNTRFTHSKGSDATKSWVEYALGSLKVTVETTSDGKKSIIFEAPALKAGEASVFEADKADKQLEELQKWFLDYDIGLATYEPKVVGTIADGGEAGEAAAATKADGASAADNKSTSGTQCDTLFFSIIRNGAHFRDKKSTGLLEVLAGISPTGRQYPKRSTVDGAGQTVYEVSLKVGDEDSTTCLNRVFPPPKPKGGGCCILL